MFVPGPRTTDTSSFYPNGTSVWEFGTDEDIKSLDVSKHEALGHGTQSRYLGPFYLRIVGLQSIIWAWIYPCKAFPYSKNGYYKFWTEKWADKLGNVIR